MIKRLIATAMTLALTIGMGCSFSHSSRSISNSISSPFEWSSRSSASSSPSDEGSEDPKESPEETRFRQEAMASRLCQTSIIDSLYTLIALAKREEALENLSKIENVIVTKQY